MQLDINKSSLDKMGALYGDENLGSMLEKLALINRPMAELIVNHGFDKVIDRPGLSYRDREIATLSLIVAQRDEEQLRVHTRNGIRAGLTIEQLQELALHWTLYIGYPQAIWGMKIIYDEYQQSCSGKSATPS